MPLVDAKIRISSHLLRRPQLFDGLGSLAGGIGRDLIIWAAWNDALVARLHLPDFCRMFGYNRQHLLRKATAAQVKEIRERGCPEEDIADYSNVIGFTLMRLAGHNFIFAAPSKDSKHRPLVNKKLVEQIDVLNVQKTGTYIEFILSEEILEQTRGEKEPGKGYQTINLADYLSLRTPNGQPDDEARKMYLRLLWKRQYWDHKTFAKGEHPSTDKYDELIAVAGYQKWKPAKNAASKLRDLLERVGALPSIRMEPTVKLNKATGKYEVTWWRDKIGGTAPLGRKAKKVKSAKAAQERYPCEPAPVDWGTAPDPQAEEASAPEAPAVPAPEVAAEPAHAAPTKIKRSPGSTRKGWRPSAPAGEAPVVVAPAPVLRAAHGTNRNKLKSELEDARNTLSWFQSAECITLYQQKYADQPALYKEHLGGAKRKVAELEQLLEKTA